MENSIREFAQLMERNDGAIDLAQAALLIACTEYPELDVASQVERFDRLAAQTRTDPARSAAANIAALNELLFEKEKFAGNESEYDDPRNSYLNDVLDRKLGIPITLSLIYAEVARRLRLPVIGVGFPGHFLVKYLTASDEILIDPFNRGAILTEHDCEERLRAQYGPEKKFKPEYLAASTPKQILARMLNNLKGSYFRRQNFPKVLTMVELSLAIDPASRQDIRDRGIVYYMLRRYPQALADLRTYLALSPPNDPEIKDALKVIHSIRAGMN